ncbi:glycosyltransferase family 2 protein [soil metagenome]
MSKKATVIVSVFNRVHELKLIFAALKIQTFKDFEVIISDDGSGKEMKDLVKKEKDSSELIIRHIHHEDKGFRKNKILNQSIKVSKTPYLIFFDGDCVPHSNFVKAHFDHRKENVVLCGRRVNLSKKLTESLTVDSIASKQYERSLRKYFLSSIAKNEKQSFNVEEGIHIKNKLVRKVFLTKKTSILGSNFSLHKRMMEKINGFDENYIGAGIGEDSDIEYRLLLSGGQLRSIRNLAIQYHLFHKSTVESDENYVYLEMIKNRKIYFCENGLKK